MMTAKFIQRPVLSIVISVLITLAGLLSLTKLPITQFPDIAPPEVNVTTKFIGANAEACVKAVVTPLERAINGVPGMAYMSSVSGNDGVSVIQIIFKAGTDPEVASVNVQNRVASVLDELPEEAIKSGVIVEKVQNSMLLYVNMLSSGSHVRRKISLQLYRHQRPERAQKNRRGRVCRHHGIQGIRDACVVETR